MNTNHSLFICLLSLTHLASQTPSSTNINVSPSEYDEDEECEEDRGFPKT